MKQRKWFLLLLLAIWVAILNPISSNTFHHVYTQDVASAVDIPHIIEGYEQTPNLLRDGLRWWHGSWIQLHLGHYYRPLSSYQMWIETWIALHWGFYPISTIGFCLLLLDCILVCVLAHRFTTSRLCILMAAVLTPLFRFTVGLPSQWLTWYTYHNDLLVAAVALGFVLFFDAWLQGGNLRALGASWACFVVLCFLKEYVVIIPFFALALCLFRKNINIGKQRFLQPLLLCCGVGALFIFRSWIIPNASNPEIQRFHIIERPVWYYSNTLWRYMATGEFWLPGLAVVLFTAIALAIRSRQSHLFTGRAALLTKPYMLLLAIIAIATIYLSLATPSAVDAIVMMIDEPLSQPKLRDLIVILWCLYSASLLWKYRKQEPTLAAITLLLLSFVPMLARNIYWHYTFIPWLIRCGLYFPLLAKLVWLDVSPPLQPWIIRGQTKVPGLNASALALRRLFEVET
jgi:hypothetical protein